MEIVNLLEAGSRTELREWLMRNHHTETECWVVVKRGRPKDDGTFLFYEGELYSEENRRKFTT